MQKYKKEIFAIKKIKEDIVVEKDCISRACESTWWNWYGSSRHFSYGGRKNSGLLVMMIVQA